MTALTAATFTAALDMLTANWDALTDEGQRDALYHLQQGIRLMPEGQRQAAQALLVRALGCKVERPDHVSCGYLRDHAGQHYDNITGTFFD